MISPEAEQTLIDARLPRFQFSEKHARTIAASPEAVLAAALKWIENPPRDPFYRAMSGLRQLPATILRSLRPKRDKGEPLPLIRFIDLGQTPGREAVLGAAGRFWKLENGLVPLPDAAAFDAYAEPGAARLAMNFTVTALADGRTRLTTETRIFCHDGDAKR